ncbi:MAG: hypothetical protein R3B09_04805 [Nannocystaceae bacterium]
MAAAKVPGRAEVVERVDRWIRSGSPHLLAFGGFGSPIAEPCDRIGLLELGDGRPRVLEDLWVRSAERGALVAALSGRPALRIGAWNVLYADGWGYAWTEDERPFALWEPQGRVVELDADALHTRHGRIARRRITAIEARISPSWDEFSVVAIVDGEVDVIARADNPAAALDPTYDGINLMVDAGWTVELGRPLAAALGVAFVDRTGT